MSGARDPVPRWLLTAAAWSWRLLVVAAGLVVVWEAFSRLRLVVVPVVAALFLATVLAPPVQWLRRHGWPALAATWAVLLVALGAIVGIVFGLVPSVQSEFAALGRELSAGLGNVEHWLVHGPLHLSRREVSADIAQLKKAVTANQLGVLKGALSGVTVVLQVVGGVLLAMVSTFFFVKDGDKISRFVLGLFAPRRAEDLAGLGAEVWRVLTGYIRGTAVNGAVNAAVLSVALLVMGIPLVVPLALLTFIGGFVPLAGAIVSGLLAALVALVSHGAVAALVVVGVTVVMHNLEGYLVGPLVLGRAVRLHPLAVVLVLAVGTLVGGIVGTFLSVPVVAVLIAVRSHYRRAHLGAESAPDEAAVVEMPPRAGRAEAVWPDQGRRAAGDDARPEGGRSLPSEGGS
jgi:predicted PurR-regulated permease PerM